MTECTKMIVETSQVDYLIKGDYLLGDRRENFIVYMNIIAFSKFIGKARCTTKNRVINLWSSNGKIIGTSVAVKGRYFNINRVVKYGMVF